MDSDDLDFGFDGYGYPVEDLQPDDAWGSNIGSAWLPAHAQAHPGQQPLLPSSLRRLYHYTTPVGLHGILTSGVFRGSNFSFLNDATEFVYGRDLAKRVLREGLRDMSGERPVARATLEQALGLVDSRSAASEVYVACFSAACDLLSQWRAYGNATGRYCVELDPDAFRTQVVGAPKFGIGPVIYDEAQQQRDIREIVANVLRQVEHDTWGFLSEETVARGATVLADRLIEVAPFLKHSGFAEEQEWRALTFLSDMSPEFEISASGIRPIVPLISASMFNSKRLPIARVVVGAVAHQLQAVKAVRLLLERSGYAGLPVDLSSIPFRG